MCVAQGITELNGDHCQKINKTFIGINYVILSFFLFSRRLSEQKPSGSTPGCVFQPLSDGGALHSRRRSVKCFPVSFGQRLPVPDVTSHSLILHAALFCLFVPI